MSDPGDGGAEAAEARVARLARAVEALDARVAELELRLSSTAARPPAPHQAAASHPPPAPPPTASLPEPKPAESATRDVPWSSQPVAVAQPSAPGWAVGPLRGLGRERLPVVLMGAAGGLALMMGVLYFAWYSVQQGWFPPEVRLVTTGLFGLAALAGAWRIAGRGQTAVAAGLGGAGLGGWFGATLVARHVHGLIAPETTLALLAGGAALGLWIATHRRLRLLATLATLGAFLTPLSVAEGTSHQHELLAYQLVVVGFLYLIESRQRWPELGALAVLGSWILFGAWALPHLDDANRVGAVAWAFVYLVALHAQAWQLLRSGRLAHWNAAPRLWVNALAAWLLASAAARGHETAWVGLAMAGVNASTAFALLRVRTAVDLGFWWRAGVAACLSVAWLQVFAFAPLRLEGTDGLAWHAAMAAAMACALIRTRRYVFLSPFLLPFVAALVESLALTGTTAALLGFAVAALPLCVALWPGRETLERAPGHFDPFLATLLVLGSMAWAAMAFVHLEDGPQREGWILLTCIAAAVPISLRAHAAPSAARSTATLCVLGGIVWMSILFASGARMFTPLPGAGGERMWQVGGLLCVALLATLLGSRARRASDEAAASNVLRGVQDQAGVLAVFALVIVAMLLVPAAIPTWTTDPENAASLNQAGWSVCWAVAGLALLVRGLLGRRATWRRAGMLALAVTGAKLVVVDLTQVSMLWRVLSFVGLGACLLLGAYAYRRLGDWVEREQPGQP